MLPTERLNRLGQSLWLDEMTRDLLDSGRLARYIAEWSVTGLTSNPTIFDRAISHGASYDGVIAELLSNGIYGEDLFFAIAIRDLSCAADLFLPTYRRTATMDGWVSLEVSPLLAYNAEATAASAKKLYAAAGKPNLFIKIPGTRPGLAAIEQTIFSGVPVNITLLFSPEQYVAAADAYMKGLERRIEAGKPPDVRSVASLFVSRWDRKIADMVPKHLKNRLGLGIGKATYKVYRDQLDSDRWQRLANCGARAQRLLFASTGVKDSSVPNTYYVDGLAVPNTINTMPEGTLCALAEHRKMPEELERDARDTHLPIGEFAKHGIDMGVLAEKLQAEGADAFVQSWRDLLNTIETKGTALRKDADMTSRMKA